jgi:hypothetical protein
LLSTFHPGFGLGDSPVPGAVRGEVDTTAEELIDMARGFFQLVAGVGLNAKMAQCRWAVPRRRP